MRLLLTVAAALWGTGTGLLLPRAAHRLAVDSGKPWNDRCPAAHPITGVFGGWLGRAQCRAGAPAGPCGPYGPSTLAVTAATTLVCTTLAAATGPHPETVVWLLATPVAVLLSLIDHRVHRLPDVLTLPLAFALAALLGLAALSPTAAGSWPTSLLGALTMGAAYLLLFLINPDGMGFGDVKLALALGLPLGWYGWPTLLTGALSGLLYGTLYGLTLVALRRADRRAAIPLGPFMVGGAFTGMVVGAVTA
ncbi:prepilin peptidase [Streptomyces sp. S.PNR 29]|uniref:prepilin peptidase n=1 Tax=Streptomyces sp. S.PNR 29 TaxID=2973805 RepID=UPI0025B2535B|nr:prepilin peptidase [Streptomyces sp. S.PNR 29]MDN0195462.1 prepilin peptidase [Streptomyces sp. S.PNR 29]